MDMVSAAKLRQTERIMNAGRPYLYKMENIIQKIMAQNAICEHFQSKIIPSGKILFVILSSDKGLCGQFNIHLLDFAKKTMHGFLNKEIHLYPVGKKTLSFSKKVPEYPVYKSLIDLNGRITLATVHTFTNDLLNAYNIFDEIHLISYEYVSRSKYIPRIVQFLPLPSLQPSTQDGKIYDDYIFEPNKEKILDTLLPQYFNSKIYMLFLEQFTCLHSARMLSMHAATKNCTELISKLTLIANKARQASITKELLEIVAGAEAIH